MVCYYSHVKKMKITQEVAAESGKVHDVTILLSNLDLPKISTLGSWYCIKEAILQLSA